MSFLTGLVRARLTSTALKWFTSRCTIEEESTITDEFGAPSVVWQVIASDVPCRLITSGGTKSGSAIQDVGAQETLMQEYRLAVPIAQLIGVNQRVTLNGDVYAIVRIEATLTDELFRQAILVKR